MVAINNFKGKLAIMLVVAFFIHVFTPTFIIYAENEKKTEAGTDAPTGFSVNARASILMEASTGKILYENNSHEALPPASVTKVMTMLLIMEAVDSGKITLDDMVTGSKNAKSMGGTTIYLEEGEQLSVHDMLKGIAIMSANDACVAFNYGNFYMGFQI